MDTFEWVTEKAQANLAKHGITFEEASTIFEDFHTKFFDDTAHSIGERREIAIGYSSSNRLLTVIFTERNGIVRIISARKTTSSERKTHEF